MPTYKKIQVPTDGQKIGWKDGKLLVPDELLRASRPLLAAERVTVAEHVIEGERLLVEYGLLIAGVAIYLTSTHPKAERHNSRNYAFWSLIIFLAVVYPASLFGPPPPTVRALAISALAIWLTIPWAAAADRHREPKP